MLTGEGIRFKGSREGVYLFLSCEEEMSQILQDLDYRLKGADRFFRASDITLHTGDREILMVEFEALQDLLSRYGLKVCAVVTSNPITRVLVRELGLSHDSLETTEVDPGLNDLPQPSDRGPQTSPPSLFLKRSLTEGESVYAEGNICIVGDVPASAEVTASGSVIVWGSLLGVVQAGSSGADDAIVCALQLAPARLQIADIVTRHPEGSPLPFTPEMAHIVDRQIMADQWEK